MRAKNFEDVDNFDPKLKNDVKDPKKCALCESELGMNAVGIVCGRCRDLMIKRNV